MGRELYETEGSLGAELVMMVVLRERCPMMLLALNEWFIAIVALIWLKGQSNKEESSS